LIIPATIPAHALPGQDERQRRNPVTSHVYLPEYVRVFLLDQKAQTFLHDRLTIENNAVLVADLTF